jgi:hypothetical protein
VREHSRAALHGEDAGGNAKTRHVPVWHFKKKNVRRFSSLNVLGGDDGTPLSLFAAHQLTAHTQHTISLLLLFDVVTRVTRKGGSG